MGKLMSAILALVQPWGRGNLWRASFPNRVLGHFNGDARGVISVQLIQSNKVFNVLTALDAVIPAH